ncbi:hypothetical protein [Streptomyces sp. AB3(2024)]|uniref:hypothetical protein n=1 Tax=Streptomyces sp. AB3(2024) TaxID=3317321 RepID=UPI0035A31F6E
MGTFDHTRSRVQDQLGEPGLVLNAAALWTTRYVDAAVEQLRTLPPEEREHDVLDEDVARWRPSTSTRRASRRVAIPSC